MRGSRRRLTLFGAAILLPAAFAAGGGSVYHHVAGLVRPEAVGAAPMVYVPAPPDRCRTARADLPATLRVLVWNVLKGQRPGWAEEFRRLARDADLVLLQEAWLREQPADRCPMTAALAERGGLAWQMVVSWVDAGGQGPSTGVATGAVAPPLQVTPLVSPETEPVIDTPKTALATAYGLEGTDARLLVVNVHALNVVSADTLALQLAQLEDRIREHDGPCLLAGDFNAWTDEKQARLRAMTARLDLAEVAFDGRPAGADARTRVFGNALDYAFVRDLAVRRATVHVTERSDHNALVLELALAAPR